MWAVAILAVVGLIVDLAIHIASFICVDPREWIQPEWAALVGFYAMFGTVFLPATWLQSRREKRAKRDGQVLPTEDPLWFKPVIWVLTAYMLFNVVVVGLTQIRHGDPLRQADGTYAVDPGHGHPLKRISEDEYHNIRRRGVRVLSGFFLGFYVAIAGDLIFTIAGKKRFKPPGGSLRSVSVLLIRRRRFGRDC